MGLAGQQRRPLLLLLHRRGTVPYCPLPSLPMHPLEGIRHTLPHSLSRPLAGDENPRFVEPTVLAQRGSAGASGRRLGGGGGGAAGSLADLDYSIGHEALAAGAGAALTYPMRGGLINDFDTWWVR